MNKISLVFFGSWKNAPVVFHSIIEEPIFEVRLAVTGSSPASGDSNPITVLAKKNNIPATIWPTNGKTTTLFEKLKQLDPDFLLITDFGYKIPKEIIDLARFGAVNVHPSLLPKYRGTTPVQAAILNGDKEIGVSVMLIDDKFDHGPLLAQAKIPLKPDTTTPAIYQKLFEIGAEMLPNALQQIKEAQGPTEAGYTETEKDSPSRVRKILFRHDSQIQLQYFNPPQPQDDTKATYTKMLKKETGRIDWLKSPSAIERMVRAYEGWPGSWTTINELRSLKLKVQNAKFKVDDRRVKILKAHLGNEGWLIIDQLQIEGKKPISWEEFARGYLK